MARVSHQQQPQVVCQAANLSAFFPGKVSTLCSILCAAATKLHYNQADSSSQSQPPMSRHLISHRKFRYIPVQESVCKEQQKKKRKNVCFRFCVLLPIYSAGFELKCCKAGVKKKIRIFIGFSKKNYGNKIILAPPVRQISRDRIIKFDLEYHLLQQKSAICLLLESEFQVGMEQLLSVITEI